MRTFSQEDLDTLIGCPKQIVENPTRPGSAERGHRRGGMTLKSVEKDEYFKVFIRINEFFPENFSIGPVYSLPNERGEIHLLRCNGKHGPSGDISGLPPHHIHCHVHRANADNIEAGLRPEKGGNTTDRYDDYRGALIYFLREVNVININDYFPELEQLQFSFTSNEE